MQHRTHFPLVGDDELVVGPPLHMALYDDKDLISNIRGDYQEPDFSESALQSTATKAPQAAEDFDKTSGQPMSSLEHRSLSDTNWHYQVPARRNRKEQLKQKQSAGYFSPSKPSIGHRSQVKQALAKPGLEQETASQLTAAANRLRQTTYILADLKPDAPISATAGEQSKQNSYDFLKHSQVYNHKENQRKKEKKVAQELNLTRFEQREKL